MRAIINTPAGPDRVALTADAPEPAPALNEALVAVEAFSLNRGELALLAARPDGWRPGQDVAGTVLRPAADGTGPAAGTKITALIEGGGWAERAAVPVRRLAVLPAGVTTTAAVTVGMAGRTALRTLALGGNLIGRRVLITGAAGGVGRFQVQLAAMAGAEVTAATNRPGATKALRSLGAASVVSHPGNASGLFGLVLEGVGGASLGSAIGKVAPGGTVVLFGASDPKPAPVLLTDFFGHENATIATYFSFAQPETVDLDLAILLGLLADGRLTAPVGLTASWADTNDALAALAAGHVDGKAVLTVS